MLPEHRSDHLRGRHRHALRNNLRKAAAGGIRCEVLDEGSRAVEAIGIITRTRRQGPLAAADLSDLRSSLSRPEVTLLVARDETGHPRAAIAAVIDEAVCLIEWATSNSHEARWALHDHLVDVLIARGVKYLLASGEGPFGALGFEPNVLRYQHLLGYELRHLRPVPARASTSHEHPHARRLRPPGYALVPPLAFLFGAVDQHLGSVWSSTHIGFWANDVSAMLAPWLALPFLVGARRGRPSDALRSGAIASLSALLGCFVMTLSPFDGVAIRPIHPLGAFVAQLHVILPALIAGPLCAWLGHRWRTTRSWPTAALIASAFCLEPLVRTVRGTPFIVPGTATAEVIVGLLLIGWFALLRARARPEGAI